MLPQPQAAAPNQRCSIARRRTMDQEGVDVQVIYGTLNLIFQLLDKDLAIALLPCLTNTAAVIAGDTIIGSNRLVYYLYRTWTAVAEMYRCVNELGMIGIAAAPNIPIPHPKAPEAS